MEMLTEKENAKLRKIYLALGDFRDDIKSRRGIADDDDSYRNDSEDPLGRVQQACIDLSEAIQLSNLRLNHTTTQKRGKHETDSHKP